MQFPAIRGRLRVYLGVAPGAGATCALLGEGHRRAEQGADTVVAVVQTGGRPVTAGMLRGLETVPPAAAPSLGTAAGEMDLDAVLARRPQVALVDELAHSNLPGTGRASRWQDVAELLAAGIDVITTVGIGHLDSLADAVAKITGVPAGETVPDLAVRAANEIELVDVTPEALRDRLAHGHIYPGEQADAALSGAFRTGPLSALRELALIWLAGSLTQNRQGYRAGGHVDDGGPIRERVMVALTGGPEGHALIRRAARIAARSRGDLLAVHVTRPGGPAGAAAIALAAQRQLTESIGGTYHQLADLDIPGALLTLARTENATQLVLGRRHRSRLAALRPRPRIRSRVIRGSNGTDVHIITHPASLPARPAACGPDRNGRHPDDHVPGRALPVNQVVKPMSVRY
jgi:two-component system sensor histidine kinase KdpD